MNKLYLLIITFVLIISTQFAVEAKTHFSIHVNSLIAPPVMRAHEGYIVEQYRPLYRNEPRYLRAGMPYEPEIIYVVPRHTPRVILYPIYQPRAGFSFSWHCR